MFDELVGNLDATVMGTFAATVPVQYLSQYADAEVLLRLIKDTPRIEDDRLDSSYLIFSGSQATFPIPPAQGDYLRTADDVVYAVSNVDVDAYGFAHLLAHKR